MAGNGAQDADLLQRKQVFYDELERRYRYFLNVLFPPDARGRHVPILMQVLDDPRQEWIQLEEIARRSQAVAEGLTAADSQTQAYDANEDGAQQRLLELRREFVAKGQ